MLSVILLSLGISKNRGQVAQIIILGAIGEGLRVFRISTVGEANTGDLPLIRYVLCIVVSKNLVFHHAQIVLDEHRYMLLRFVL